MMIIRPIELADLENYKHFAQTASEGITNLPKNPELLEKKIHKSLHSFKKNSLKPEEEEYIFVLENPETGEIGGTSSICAKVGAKDPLFFYKVETIYPHSKHLCVPKEMRILTPVSYQNGASEIRALYLMPKFRSGGWGRLLSLSRFLFIACHPHRFESKVIAEMRGFISENNVAPFWEGLGRKFLDIDFPELMRLQEYGLEFVQEILPRWPVYASLLSIEAQDAIGKTHHKTKFALCMLFKEGFYLTNEIDIFDAGPKVEAETQKIKTIALSVVAKVDSITRDETSEGGHEIICNLQTPFRACYGNIQIRKNNHITLSRKVAEALRIKEGDHVRYSSPLPSIFDQTESIQNINKG